jgi:hypothetical protein
VIGDRNSFSTARTPTDRRPQDWAVTLARVAQRRQAPLDRRPVDGFVVGVIARLAVRNGRQDLLDDERDVLARVVEVGVRQAGLHVLEEPGREFDAGRRRRGTICPGHDSTDRRRGQKPPQPFSGRYPGAESLAASIIIPRLADATANARREECRPRHGR